MSEIHESQDKSLSSLFVGGYKLFEEINSSTDPFNSAEFQNSVKKSISVFEQCTKIVSAVGMFSSNEESEEIAPENLKFLLLPFFLGQLSCKISASPRQEVLKISEIYYKDFITRCEEYGFQDKNSKALSSTHISDPHDLIGMADRRAVKLQQYRQKTDLEAKISSIKALIVREETVDDDVQRDFYKDLIQLALIDSSAELDSIKQELAILEHRKTLEHDKNETDRPAIMASHKHTHQPLQPVIITKDEAQKAIFGLGYPSLPIMTVNEFYNQRVADGIFPDPEKADPAGAQKPFGVDLQSAENEEREKEEKERLEEMDDEEYLVRQRNKDEYKDIVRRGDGNRYNKS